MNKLAKGAIATGVGIILLVGGGGTLATWNQAQNASMGAVVAGDLNLVADAGAWKNASNTPIPDISKYHVVPGDTLTYTQPLNVTLTGDLMAANLTVEGAAALTGFGSNATVTTTLTDAKSAAVLPGTVLTSTGKVIASTTFTFNKSTDKRDAHDISADLGGIGYKLVQMAPTNSNLK